MSIEKCESYRICHTPTVTLHKRDKGTNENDFRDQLIKHYLRLALRRNLGENFL